MNRRVYFHFVYPLMVFLLIAGIKGLKPENDKQIEDLWQEAKKYEKAGKARSALEVVERIYRLGAEKKEFEHQINAIAYMFKYLSEFDENPGQKTLNFINHELKTAGEPLKSLLFALKAEILLNYYRNYQYMIDNKAIQTKDVPEEIKYWTSLMFRDEIVKAYESSLAHPRILKKYPVKQMEWLVKQGTAPDYACPTLFELLSRQVLKFYKSAIRFGPTPVSEFTILNDSMLQWNFDFINANISSPDTLDFTFRALRMYQKVMFYNDTNFLTRTYFDLERAEYIYSISASMTRENAWSQYLDSFIYHNSHPELRSLALYKKALLFNNGFQVNNKYHLVSAVEICEKTIAQYPQTYGSQLCRSLLSRIKARSLQMKMKKVVLPGLNFPVLISYKNIPAIWYKVVALDARDIDKLNNTSQDVRYRILRNKKAIYFGKFKLPDKKDYENHTTELILNPLGYGHYALVISSHPHFMRQGEVFQYAQFQVSELSIIKENNYFDRKNWVLHIINSRNGMGVHHPRVNIYERLSYRKGFVLKKSLKGDKNGIIAIARPFRGYYKVVAIDGKDSIAEFYSFYEYRHYQKEQQKLWLFTDRSIYRPGQTVFFKGILTSAKMDEGKYQVIPQTKLTIKLMDANYRIIATKELTTNDFGSCSDSFRLPENILTGIFRLDGNLGQQTFRVEEYKRPKFYVKLDTLEKVYKPGDTVIMQGKAQTYSNVGLNKARVQWQVKRKTIWPIWYRWYFPDYRNEDKIIGYGVTETSPDGRFSFQVPLVVPSGNKSLEKSFFQYEISVTVTAENGETHSARKWLKVSRNPLDGFINIPDHVDISEQNTLFIKTFNTEAKSVDLKGTLKIYRLKIHKTLLRERSWELPDLPAYSPEEYSKLLPYDVSPYPQDTEKVLVIHQQVNSNVPILFTPKWQKKLEQGTYLIDFKGKDKTGHKIHLAKKTVFYDSRSQLPALSLPAYFISKNNKIYPGNASIFILGTADSLAYFFIRAYQGNRLIYFKDTLIHQGQIKISIPVTEKERGGFWAEFSSIKLNKIYQRGYFVDVPWDNKKLDIVLKTYRKNTEPGSKERWTIQIKQKNNKIENAELLADLYDASLDEIIKHKWAFNPFYKFGSVAAFHFNSGFLNAYNQNLTQGLNKFYYAPGQIWPDFIYKDVINQYPIYYIRSVRLESGEIVRKRPQLLTKKVTRAEEVAETEANSEEPYSAIHEGSEVDLTVKSTSVRKNFAETAFFFPHLISGQNGQVKLQFTMPESLTRWKLLLLAHTRDLKIGFLEEEIISSKKLMLTTNNPRFLRVGDEIFYSVSIANQSGNKLNGKCKLEILNPLQDSQSYKGIHIFQPVQTYQLENNSSLVLKWRVKVSNEANPGIMVFRVVTAAGHFEDGEENAVPLLPDKTLVIESLPFYASSGETNTFVHENFKNNQSDSSIKQIRLTLEATPNPAWLAVMSLPYLMEFPYECNEQLFNRLYANSLTLKILNENPEIKKVVKKWGQSGSMHSPLMKNEELKSLILEETPWLQDANSETEAFQKLIQLANESVDKNYIPDLIDKLDKNQNSDGGWPWFNGMRSNPFVTQYILTGFGKLIYMHVFDTEKYPALDNTLKKALEYADNYQRDIYFNLKKIKGINMNADHLGYYSIQYLYMRSFYSDESFGLKDKIAFQYWKEQAEKYWTSKTLMAKAMIAIALKRFGSDKKAQEIIASLKETALFSREMGMYWKNNRPSYYWYQAPIETQAHLIEAFMEVTRDTHSVDKMRIWLLKQKQTRSWKSTKATADACYSLLLQGTPWLNTSPGTQIWLGNQKIDFDESTIAGTFYLKKSWEGKNIDSSYGTVTIKKTNEGICWGALHWQYLAPYSKITSYESHLRLERQILLRENTASGETYRNIREGEKIPKGSTVLVKMIVESDRDMEFVHLKDMRAASLEPVLALSGYRYENGLGYYVSIKDEAVHFFFDYLPKGTWTLSYELFVSQEGKFENGIASIQCMYAPEFNSHTGGFHFQVSEK